MKTLILILILILFAYGCEQIIEVPKVSEIGMTITYIGTEPNGANKWCIENQSNNYIPSVTLVLYDNNLKITTPIELGPFAAKEQRILYCNESITPTIR